MNKKIVDDYEDAWLAIMLNKLAEEDGKKQQEEAHVLNNDASFDFPDSLDSRCYKTIAKGFRKRSQKRAAKAIGKVAKRLAIVILAIGCAASVLFFTVDAFRVAVYNTFENTKKSYTSITATPENENTSQVRWTPKWIPDGYTENILSSQEHNILIRYMSTSNDSDTIIFSVLPIATSANLDTENALSVTKMEFHNYQAYYIIKDGNQTLSWFDTGNQVEFTLSGSAIEKDILFRMADSIYD